MIGSYKPALAFSMLPELNRARARLPPFGRSTTFSMASSLVIGGSLYTAATGGGDSDWERYYPYEHPELFSGEPIKAIATPVALDG